MGLFVDVPTSPGTQGGLYVRDVGKLIAVCGPCEVDGGTISAQFPLVGPPDYAWYVERITVQTTGTKTPLALFYDGPAMLTTQLVEGTTDGGLNIADESSPLLLLDGDQLVVAYEGCSLGAVATTRIQYRALGQS